jgi:hypothetical protein
MCLGSCVTGGAAYPAGAGILTCGDIRRQESALTH